MRVVSASALGRPASAHHDRDGAGARARAADRRRADDGARRDHAGADPRADPRAACASTARACCSSRTISASSPRSPTASPCCGRASWWSSGAMREVLDDAAARLHEDADRGGARASRRGIATPSTAPSRVVDGAACRRPTRSDAWFGRGEATWSPRRPTCRSKSAVARRWGSSASRDRARATVARCIARLIEPTAGRIVIGDTDFASISRARAARAAPQGADRLPGPVPLAQSAAHGGRRRSSKGR